MLGDCYTVAIVEKLSKKELADFDKGHNEKENGDIKLSSTTLV